jgi:TonB family protein
MQPWAAVSDDDARFWRISTRVLGIALVVCLVMPWLPVVKPEPPAPPAPSVPVARLLLPDRPPVLIPLPEPVKPPVVAVAPEAVKKIEAPRPEPVKPPVPYKPVLTNEPIPAAKTPVPDRAPGESTEGARKKAATAGLFAGNEDMGALRAKVTAVQMNTDIKQGPGVGTGVGKGVGAGNEDGTPERAMITSNVTAGSGGINTAAYSRNTGGAGLGGRNTTLVAGGFDGGVDGGTGTGRSGNGTGGGRGAGGLGGEGNGTGTGTGRGGTLNKGGGGRASRSIEEIRVVFDRNKGSIYAIYNRALRDEPALQGKVVLKLTIAPSGALVDCRIESSELHAAELEAKLLARIRQFDFGAKDVDQITVTWPVDFLPS